MQSIPVLSELRWSDWGSCAQCIGGSGRDSHEPEHAAGLRNAAGPKRESMIQPRTIRLMFLTFGILLLILASADIYRGRLHGWSGQLWLRRCQDPVKFWVASLLLVALLAGWITFAMLPV